MSQSREKLEALISAQENLVLEIERTCASMADRWQLVSDLEDRLAEARASLPSGAMMNRLSEREYAARTHLWKLKARRNELERA